jgi:conjugative relaxase-like TrwC/TraI family protein
MMSATKRTSEQGVIYLEREVASGDERRPRGSELTDYYTAEGNPPGRWMGSGTALVGVSGTVTEAQMRALFGEGLHPNADHIIAEAIQGGATPKKALAQAKLGRAYPQYKENKGKLSPVIEKAVTDFEGRHKRLPGEQELAAICARIGAAAFLEDHGRRPRNAAELARYVKQQTTLKQHAVAALELQFVLPEKSFSIAWALGDRATRLAIEESHEQAIADTLRWIELNALMTRTGAHGVAQEEVQGGLIAARYRHYDSRLGDPLLHDHVVVANKVLGLDGKWRSIDGRLLFGMAVAASEFYNQRVIEYVCGRLGLRVVPHEVTPGKRPVMRLAGIESDMVDAASNRSKDIRVELAKLEDAYWEKHGRAPGTVARIRLAQQATNSTRPYKKKARSLAALRLGWREDAIARFGADRVDNLLATAQAAAAALDGTAAAPEDIDVEGTAAEVIDTISELRAVWGKRHILAEVRRRVVELTAGQASSNETEDLVQRIADHAWNIASVSIVPPDPNPRFAPLQRSDGSSIYRRRECELATSMAMLQAEERILSAARTSAIPAVSQQLFDQVEQQVGGSLDDGQRQLARAFACAETVLVAGIGPAGAGKTTALRLTVAAVTAAGGRVIALAPSSRAAQVMADDLGVAAHTLHTWLQQRDQGSLGQRVDRVFDLRAGDVIVVDEAGMAGTARLARIVEQAEAAGAHIRLMGDPAQLAAVESGGALRLIASEVGAIELEQLHRFQTAGEGDATLALRDGNPTAAWSWYLNEGRVVGGDLDAMVDAVFAAWQSDIEAGRNSLMMAEETTIVRDLNIRAQAFRLASGLLDTAESAPLRDQAHAYVGDVIVTRHNQRRRKLRGGRDFVKNGDTWLITDLAPDGTATVRHTGHGGRTTLPAHYLERHVELGYASTVHRAQGRTVDTAHGLLTSRCSREAAYVQATRGAHSNRLYVVTDGGQTMQDVLEKVAATSRPSISAHETIRAEQDRVWSIGQLADEYADVHARADDHRLKNIVRTALGPAAEAFISAEAWHAVARSMRDAEADGWSLEDLVLGAYSEAPFDDADEIAAVLSWRVDSRVLDGRKAMLDAASTVHEPGRSRPLADVDLEHLLHLAESTESLRRRAMDDLHAADGRVSSQPRLVVVDGLPCPAWPHRTHGTLTRAQLAEALYRARSHMRWATEFNDREKHGVAAAAHAALQREQGLRRRMSHLDRVREDWQREPRVGASHTAFQSTDATQRELVVNFHRREEARERLHRAEVIGDRIRAERRWRERLPQASAPIPDDTATLPDWLAPSAALLDFSTPEPWRRHLEERRGVLLVQLDHVGRSLAIDPPAWSRVLGPVPAPEHDLCATWTHVAALADSWRARRSVPPDVPGIGPCPDTKRHPREALAWTVLSGQVAALGRRARGVAAALARTEEPATAMRIAARIADHLRLQMLALPGPSVLGDDGLRSTSDATAYADGALIAALGGGEDRDPWTEHVLTPDADDPEQQEHWRDLVAALAEYRYQHAVDGDDPLGDVPDDEEGAMRWEALGDALSLYRRARIQDRLASLRGPTDEGQGASTPPVTEPNSNRRVRRGRNAREDRHPHRPGTDGPRGGPRI